MGNKPYHPDIGTVTSAFPDFWFIEMSRTRLGVRPPWEVRWHRNFEERFNRRLGPVTQIAFYDPMPITFEPLARSISDHRQLGCVHDIQYLDVVIRTNYSNWSFRPRWADESFSLPICIIKDCRFHDNCILWNYPQELSLFMVAEADKSQDAESIRWEKGLTDADDVSVYADWCEENGRGFYADFLRCYCVPNHPLQPC